MAETYEVLRKTALLLTETFVYFDLLLPIKNLIKVLSVKTIGNFIKSLCNILSKALDRSVIKASKYFFLDWCLAAPVPTLGYDWRSSLNHLMSTTAFFVHWFNFCLLVYSPLLSSLWLLNNHQEVMLGMLDNIS